MNLDFKTHSVLKLIQQIRFGNKTKNHSLGFRLALQVFTVTGQNHIINSKVQIGNNLLATSFNDLTIRT